MSERFLTEDGPVPGYDEEGDALMADSNWMTEGSDSA